jgi:hypothetical protein
MTLKLNRNISVFYAIMLLVTFGLSSLVFAQTASMEEQENKIEQECERNRRPHVKCACAKEHYAVFREEAFEKRMQEVMEMRKPGNFCEKNNIPYGTSHACPTLPDETFDATGSYMMRIPSACADYEAIQAQKMHDCMRNPPMIKKTKEEFCPCYTSEQMKKIKEEYTSFGSITGNSRTEARMMANAKNACDG